MPLKKFGAKFKSNSGKLPIEIKGTKNPKPIYYHENIGWQLILHDKTCVILPERKLNEVLNFFENRIKSSKIYYDYRFYDMRVLERIYLSKKNKCLSF